MQKGQIAVGMMGMNQDMISPKVNSRQAFEIKNFRINPTGHSNGIELTTEKGTKTVSIMVYQSEQEESENRSIQHEQDFPWWHECPIIGHCVINEHLVLFMKGGATYQDRIVHLELMDDGGNEYFLIRSEGSFYGDLDFDEEYKIEAIASYESEDIIKVYWVDGKNHPRVINIMQDYDYPNVQTYDPFSFYQQINPTGYNRITIDKQYVGGLFYSGVVQYSFSFYNRNAQETPVIFTTPLNYISHSDKGEAPNEQLGCAFKLTFRIDRQDHDKFEYIRVYSIYRSSINGTPVVKVINDIRCDQMEFIDQQYYSCSFVDTNEQGYDFDAYKILVQNEHIIPNAISYKDSKMFLANYESKMDNLEWDSFLDQQNGIEWDSETKSVSINNNQSEGVYTYRSQLEGNSKNIKIFKQNEYYKLGIQFQDKYGKWSEPFIIGTFQNTSRIQIGSANATVYLPSSTKSVGQIRQMLNQMQPDNEYINVRAVASFPTVSERSILCQGVMNPTVFNFKQRKDNTCRAQSSWFFRPAPKQQYDSVQGGFGFAQYKNNNPLYPSNDVRGEIQCMYFDKKYIGSSSPLHDLDPIRPVKNYTQITDEDGQKYDHCYFVDYQYQTINSPDIEFDDNLKNVDLSQYGILSTQGYVIFKNLASKYTIVATPQLFLNSQRENNDDEYYIRSNNMATGAYTRTYGYFGGRAQSHGRLGLLKTCWYDDACNLFTTEYSDVFHVLKWNERKSEIPYAVYPWQRQYLNNYNKNHYDIANPSASDSDKFGITKEEESSKIIRKVLSNMRFCDTLYIQGATTGMSDFECAKLYSSKESQILKFDDDLYYGNVDQLVTCTSEYKGWKFYQGLKDDNTRWQSWNYGNINGYPIIADTRRLVHINPNASDGEYGSIVTETADHTCSQNVYLRPLDGIGLSYDESGTNPGSSYSSQFDIPTPNVSSTDTIMIRYKSTPHLVCKFESSVGGSSLYDSEDASLPLVDISRDATNLPYRNNSEFDVVSREWVPCNDPISLNDIYKHVVWSEGNAYLQRYDCLKTYPFSSDDYQSVVEIASFVVETYVNLDGRYDNNRGLLDNTYVNPTNFNLINKVYSQQNNFFNYSQLDDQAFKTHDFPTRFTWSLDKINGQEIDEWTRTNTAAFYDCDGDKGQITSLRRFNNQIYAFQEKGISRIKYNENAIINTENGTPIELGNSATVNGVDYVSEMIGSQNKWSCISTPVGIFFVDNYTPGIYRLGGGKQVLTCLTDNCMQRWFEQRNEEWFINTASYDGNMNETIFTYGDEGNENSIVYNNDYEIFSSFYDYQGVVGNIKSHSFNIHSNNIYFLREGNTYNTFYGSTKPYWITFVANPTSESGPNANCVFDNVWYNADVVSDTNEENMNYDELIEKAYDIIPRFHGYTTTSSVHSKWYETFNVIEAGNDYQYGIFEKSSQYSYATQTKYFEFIKKFRTWRVPVPRSQRNAPESQRPFVNLNRDRMRGQWLRIKLENDNPSTDKMILRDILVDVLN